MIDGRLVINGTNNITAVIVLADVRDVRVKEYSDGWATVITEVNRVVTIRADTEADAKDLQILVSTKIGGPIEPVKEAKPPAPAVPPSSRSNWKLYWPPTDGKYYSIIGHNDRPFFIRSGGGQGGWATSEGTTYTWLCYWHHPDPVPLDTRGRIDTEVRSNLQGG